MRLKLADLASLAEIVGTVAVVISLVFVGIQVRDGNRETRAATLQTALQTEMDLNTVALNNVDMWQRIISGEPLGVESDVEMRRAILLFNLIMIESENWFQQFESGILDEETWRTRREVISELVELPVFEVWRGTPGARGHSTNFLALVDAAAKE